jgi:hypothetical protein
MEKEILRKGIITETTSKMIRCQGATRTRGDERCAFMASKKKGGGGGENFFVCGHHANVRLGRLMVYPLTENETMYAEIYGHMYEDVAEPEQEMVEQEDQEMAVVDQEVVVVEPDVVEQMEDVSKVCAICLDEIFEENMNVKKLAETRCGHVYHEECMTKWLMKKRTCPECREVIGEVSESKVIEARLMVVKRQKCVKYM